MSIHRQLVRSGDLAREFNLPQPQVRRIVLEHTRQALLRSGAAWAVLLAGWGVAGWFLFGPAQSGELAVKILIGTAVVWLVAGRMLAGPAIRQAARDRSERPLGTSG